MLEKYYPYAYVKDVFSIDYAYLYRLGYRAILFDVDNTLVHHGDNSTEEVDALFKKIHQFGFKTLLLTNNDEERVLRFIKNIDTLYICEADKPNPKNYLKAVEMLNLKKEQVLFVGDQIFVDIVGANRCGMASILVHFIRLKEEKWIGKRRYLEKIILFFYKRSKKYNNRLGNVKIKERI